MEPPLSATSGLGSAYSLPKTLWCQVLSFLYTHELLGRVAVLSGTQLALFGDEHFWATLALPPGSERLHRLLSLLLVEERQLWRQPLRQIQQLDLDLELTTLKTARLLQQLLVRGLGLEGGALQSMTVRHIPLRPQLDGQWTSKQGKYTPKDLKLVNPVLDRAPDEPLPVFLLDRHELSRLRLLMADFRYFRLHPSLSDVLVKGAPLAAEAAVSSLDLRALRRRPGGPRGGTAPEATDADAASLLQAELGALRRLPKSCWRERSFEAWTEQLLDSYEQLLLGWRS